ncbi:Protein of unknown function [Pyronema omphalodes CBS 100304]|uniref:Uncharacterized protein n=1 Tax=Pyronema omphalodes (strain CBS 100304) TaxID=1076935 RepID=U4LJQ5_PYROM|nr:Protein of unknown function [Pyronema omphalodes CBS 100304]
MSENVWKC